MQYPNLSLLIQMVGKDTFGARYTKFIKPVTEWSWPAQPVSATLLEQQAAKLNFEEMLVLATGGEDAKESVIADRGIEELGTFVFDLHDSGLLFNFFKE